MDDIQAFEAFLNGFSVQEKQRIVAAIEEQCLSDEIPLILSATIQFLQQAQPKRT